VFRIGWSAAARAGNPQTAKEIGSFVADERRVRQILFNLLANA
jgi:signal transduction histidine kinase